MEQEHIVLLIQKYMQGTLTAEEEALLEQWKIRSEENSQLLDQVQDNAWLREQLEAYHLLAPQDVSTDSANLAHQIAKPRPATDRRHWLRYSAAAVVLIALGLSIWFWRTAPEPSAVDAEILTQQIVPGGNRATLTLSDGTTVDLDQRKEGIVMTDDQITYNDGVSLQRGQLNTKPMKNNLMTLKTPRGGMYQLALPDGSKVWLNAASSLSYPSRFTDKERVVELQGEAYFQVVKTGEKHSIPFRVRSNGQDILVLGTEFNVTSYADESDVRTTLVRGAVKVSYKSSEGRSRSVQISPGQQARTAQGRTTVQHVDTAPYTSWRDGRFSFEGKAFAQIMNELARWYDIEVRYTDDVPQVDFYGGAFRNKDITFILDMLESAGVAYRLEGRVLVISSKKKEVREIR